ncbi:isochorismatase family protein [Rothia kristinae]|uniref:Isochorismatase family protein n=1 Tax=Rothia kristinae TaxID=37923 RepID=A0A7T4T4Y9_9MICC|nr:isochorismatase family protein [Rothia kristinae]QQC60135.1 isochorismatase family protein [Rothia kristinae]
MPLPTIPAYTLPQDRPPAAVDWTADPTRSALLVHDMQTYFFDAFQSGEDGAEGEAGEGSAQGEAAPVGAAQIDVAVGRIAALLETARKAGIPIVYTAQPPRQDPADRALLTDFWGTGLSTDAQARIIDELAPAEGDIVLPKWRYSAFMRSTLREQLLARGLDQLVITGVYAHIGCLATALDAFMLDIQAFLVADALADFTREDHVRALDYAAGRCARVQDAAEILSSWRGAQDEQGQGVRR